MRERGINAVSDNPSKLEQRKLLYDRVEEKNPCGRGKSTDGVEKDLLHVKIHHEGGKKNRKEKKVKGGAAARGREEKKGIEGRGTSFFKTSALTKENEVKREERKAAGQQALNL